MLFFFLLLFIRSFISSVLARFTPSDPQRRNLPSSLQPKPVSHIVEEFHHYIHNHIPARLIDTSTLTFVERKDVFDLFSSEIAQITEEDVQRQIATMGVDTKPEQGIYVSVRKKALRQIIREVVRYAVFSHRWTGSEPTYQHMSGSTALRSLRKKHTLKTAGLTKLARLCETAHAQGYKLVWSDTCCINDTNHAEVSEAIHAMFKWYAHAHLCIVHLAGSLSLADFEREPWFTRGWTLQELLAPRRLKFYNASWHPFTPLDNDKADLTLMSALSAVTGIPRDVVVADNTRGVKGRSISEIMSWASKRKTTRVEDAAYSLYGLFDVHPPIAYGEGEKAFAKLVGAIVEEYPTWDVFAWCGEASEKHPALPSSPSCYQKWDKAMIGDGVGMTQFTLTAHGLRLVSVPLIPMVLVSEASGPINGSYMVTLSPRPDATTVPGVFGNVTVVCGSGRLPYICEATDLHVCILNYKPNQRNHRGELQVGRSYVCFLLYTRAWNVGEWTWLKVATDNVLQIVCKGVSAEGRVETDNGGFHLPLTTTCIRAPRAQSTILMQ